MSYEKCCRLCLKELNGPGIDCITVSELKDAILLLFEVQISRTDITRSICNKCFENVMLFKAYKKTVNECQILIQDYQSIKKKINECHSNITPIKQEIIDLCEEEKNNICSKNKKRKLLLNGQVTDSQINDVLDIVHDNSSLSKNYKNHKKSSNKKTKNNNNKNLSRLNNELITSIEQNINNTHIQTETESNNREHIETNVNVLSNLNEISEQLNNVVNNETSTITNPLQNNLLIEQEIQNNSINIEDKQIKSSEQINSNNECSDNNVTTTTIQNNNSFSTIYPKSWIGCPCCEIYFQTVKATKVHLLKKHKISKYDPLYMNIKPKYEKNYNKNNKKSYNKQYSLKESRPRSTSSIVTRNMQILSESSIAQYKTPISMNDIPTKKNHTLISTISKHTYKVHNNNPNDHLNETMDSTTNITTITSPIVESITNGINNDNDNDDDDDDDKTDHDDTNNSYTEDINYIIDENSQQNIPTTTKKRVITISLLRTRESVNFRYCDQYKKCIDFNTVSPEELIEIRNSLMSPDIWDNLNNVFKTTPPDDNTREQLKRLFGNDFQF